MEATKDDFVNKGQAYADKAADKAQGGIEDAKAGVNSAASTAAKKVESMRSGAGQVLDKAADRAQGALDSVSGAADSAKQMAADAQDSVVSYTRAQPVKALLMAAGVGAVLVTLIRAFSPSRES